MSSRATPAAQGWLQDPSNTEFVRNLVALDPSTLDLSGHTLLQTLPDSVTDLRGLTKLDLSGCAALESLPDRAGSMGKLQQLNLSGCAALKRLPASVHMYALQVLKLSGCAALEGLPDDIGELRSWSTLLLSGCTALVKLPAQVSKLPKLAELDLTGCPGLMGLLELDLGGCGSLLLLLGVCDAQDYAISDIWAFKAAQISGGAMFTFCTCFPKLNF
jgi:Leucine-rich repeat (LRR) protein